MQEICACPILFSLPEGEALVQILELAGSGQLSAKRKT
ncbi:hypothetical protein PAUR_a1621 [Pseudoalteromonas aurantia 208]|uniref:Uncharacterized protein n=1 Tax=Pseudoalteromonas aurantia 208 TaxID=1314867 RepID=A0ABR9EAV4_9GAMM|nr:hypothetical protein [Pseudoalteromonas aurantia 208]